MNLDELKALCLEKHYAAKGMRHYGGSFTQALSVALDNADHKNTAKIKATWPEYWTEFYEFGKQMESKLELKMELKNDQ